MKQLTTAYSHNLINDQNKKKKPNHFRDEQRTLLIVICALRFMCLYLLVKQFRKCFQTQREKKKHIHIHTLSHSSVSIEFHISLAQKNRQRERKKTTRIIFIFIYYMLTFFFFALFKYYFTVFVIDYCIIVRWNNGRPCDWQ